MAVVIPFRQDSRSGGDQPVARRLQSAQAGHRATVGTGIEPARSALASISTTAATNCKSRTSTTRNRFEQVHDKLLDEVQLENEQRHLAAGQSSSLPTSRAFEFPRCWNIARRASPRWSVYPEARSPATAWTPRDAKRRLARLVAKALIAKPIFSKSDQPLFHGDPHAGNLFLTDDGCLGILDWSLAGTLGVNERIAIVQIVLAAITLDADRIVSALSAIGRPRTA